MNKENVVHTYNGAAFNIKKMKIMIFTGKLMQMESVK